MVRLHAYLPQGWRCEKLLEWDDARPWTGDGLLELVPVGTPVRPGWWWDGAVWHADDEALPDLDTLRARLKRAIGAAAGRQFADGFVFRDQVVSGSLASQVSLTALQVGADRVKYPLSWLSQDDRALIVLEGPDDVRALFDALLGWLQATKTANVDSKQAVGDARTAEDAIAAAAAYLEPRRREEPAAAVAVAVDTPAAGK